MSLWALEPVQPGDVHVLVDFLKLPLHIEMNSFEFPTTVSERDFCDGIASLEAKELHLNLVTVDGILLGNALSVGMQNTKH